MVLPMKASRALFTYSSVLENEKKTAPVEQLEGRISL